MARIKRITSVITDEVEIDRYNRSRGSWIWHEGVPCMVVSMERLDADGCRVVLEQATVDEDSMVYKHRGKALVFGRDHKVLEKWMDEEYVDEDQKPDPWSDNGDDAELAGA